MPEPMKAYRCKYHCGKIGTQKARIAEHEAWCFHNPQSQSCKTCDHSSDVECLKLGISFEFACSFAGIEPAYRLQTRCMYYDNAEEGIYGAAAPADAPKPNKYISPHRQFEATQEASHD